jgi:hypothetical protein
MCISDQNVYLNSIQAYFHFQIAKCTQWNTFDIRNEENAKGNDERNVHPCVVPCVVSILEVLQFGNLACKPSDLQQTSEKLVRD